MTSNNRFERSRGTSSLGKEGVDVRDESASLVGNAASRRSTSSLGTREVRALVIFSALRKLGGRDKCLRDHSISSRPQH